MLSKVKKLKVFMKIELITAESEDSRNLRKLRLIQFPQLTMPLIAALTPGDTDIHHTDEIVEPVDFERKVDLVAITLNTPAAPHAYEIADEFRRRKVPVVLGGPHVIAIPEEARKHADAIVIGEAEDTWPTLVEDFKQGKMQAVYKSTRSCTLKGLPWARRDLIIKRRYGRGVIIATRGCNNRACDYCSISLMYGNKMRFRPVMEVAAEIASISGRAAIFWDDNISADPEYSKKLFRHITPFKKWWTSQAVANIAYDEEFLRLAAKSGCKALFLGLESVNQRSLDSAYKPFNKPSQYKEIVKRFHEYGIAVQAGLVFGFDHDDKSTFERTVELFNEAGVDSATVSILVPMPGTILFKRLQKQDRMLTYDWFKYNGKTDCVYRPALMTPEELVAGTEWAARQIYSYNSIFKRLIVKSRVGLWWNLPRNLGYKLSLDLRGNIGFNPAKPKNVTSAILGAQSSDKEFVT